jgi:hypothetical protein
MQEWIKPTPFSSRASTCESKRPTVPVESAHTLTPSLPFPSGMDPVTSSLGVSHVTSGSPGNVGDGGGAGGVGGAGLGLGGGCPARYQYPAFTPAAMTPQPYSTKPSILVPVGVVMLTAMVPFQYGSNVPVVIKRSFCELVLLEAKTSVSGRVHGGGGHMVVHTNRNKRACKQEGRATIMFSWVRDRMYSGIAAVCY